MQSFIAERASAIQTYSATYSASLGSPSGTDFVFDLRGMECNISGAILLSIHRISATIWHGKALRAHISRPIARRSGQRRGANTQHHQGSSFPAHKTASPGGMFLPYRGQHPRQTERGCEEAGPDHSVRHHEWSVGDIPASDPGAAGVRGGEGLGRSGPAGAVGRTTAIVDDLAARRDSALNQLRRSGASGLK